MFRLHGQRATSLFAKGGGHLGSGRLWTLPGLVFLVTALMTIALWRAEVRLERFVPAHWAYWILIGGLLCSLLLAASVFWSLVQRSRTQYESQRQQAALESLSAISTAVNARLGTGADVLDQLAESARQLLQMDRCSIRLLDERNRTLRLMASAGDGARTPPKNESVDDVPGCRQGLDSGEIQWDGAAGRIIVPLDVEGRRLGVLVLNSSGPREFTDFDRRLGKLLGAQAAVLLANSRMYQQMKDALQSRSRLLRQRQALAAANAVIQSTDPLHDSLQQIVKIVPAAVGADMCGLSLITGPGLDSVVAAATPPFDSIIGSAVTGPNPAAEHVFGTGEPLVIRDARHDARLHATWKKIGGIGSMLYLPMFHSNREPLGVFALVRYVTGRFSQEQVELARTFAAVTAVAVENTRLLEQTRRDADAKTVLLRELNHRVKNNLAGIVGLLSFDVPDMSAPVRAWLDRATDRIRVMAGTHQLFTGEEQSVDLKDLVGQTVSALSVARHPGVSVYTDFDGVAARLRGDRAVSLAMALHELCYNALIHGLSEGGTLTIRARRANHAAVAIDVVDEGTQARAAETTPPHATGQGLALVQGLVGRELHGTLTLRPGDVRGTVATIEFPLRGDEKEGRS